MFSPRINVTLPPDLFNRVAVTARRESRSLSRQIVHLVRQAFALEDYRKQAKERRSR